LIDPAYEAPYVDLDSTGRHEQWKTNRLMEIRRSNGESIIPDKLYTLATSDFLVTGGDDFGWPMSQIPTKRKNLDTGVLTREALISFIQESGPLNSVEHPVIDPEHPRLILEKPKRKSKMHRRKHHQKNHAKLDS
jgi:2',3'-cyclic-nucleotide 2'-phosphodiesterase (5'-nucleotidase family)